LRYFGVGMSILRLAAIDVARRRAMPAVMLVALATAAALAMALPLMQSAAAEEGLRSALASLGTGANLELGLDHVDSTAAFDTFQDDASRRVRAEMGSVMIPGARFARSNQLQGIELNGRELVREVGDPLPSVVYYENLQRHVVVTSGQWPADAKDGEEWPAALSEQAASLLGLKTGDRYCMTSVGVSRGNPFGLPRWCARITAVFKPTNPAEPYWAGQQLGSDLAVGLNSIFEIAQQYPYVALHANQLYVSDLSRVHAADAGAIEQHLRNLAGVYGVTSNATFITGLDAAIRVFLTRLQTQRALALSIQVSLLAVAVFAIGLATGHYLGSRRRLIGLWRARGGSRSQAWRLLMTEVTLLSLVAVPLGAVAGFVAVGALTARLFAAGDFLASGVLASSLPAFAIAIGVMLVVIGVLAGEATRGTVADVRRNDSRPAATAWWRWRGIDLALALAGVLLIAEFRFEAGQFSTASATDPLGLLLPSAGLGLLALAALRLLPLTGRVIAGGRGLGTRLARWRLQREPLRHAAVAFLLSVAVAVGLFSSAYLATDHRNAVDRARYAAGADVRAGFAFGTGPSVVDAAVAAAPGVLASSLVYRGDGRPGRSDVDTAVLGVDGYSFGGVAYWRDDFASRPAGELMEALVRGDPDGRSVPGTPTSMSLWVYSSGLDASLEMDLLTAAGRPVHATFGDLAFHGWSQLAAPLSGVATGDYPLKIRTIAIRSTGPRSTGNLAFSDLPGSGGWWHEIVGEFGGAGPLQASDQKHGDQPAVGMPVDLTGRRTIALHPVPADAPLPGIMSSRTARQLGIAVGQTFPLHIETNDVNVRLVATADYFPTLYPGQDDFLIVPVHSLAERLRLLNAYIYPNEAWIQVASSPAAAASAIDSATHGRTRLVDRETLERLALRSPLRLSLDAALVIGFVAALAMVVITFGLHFLAIARSRVSESAIMQANGLPWRVVDEGLLAEQLVVLAHGLVVGAALGVALALAILPVVQTSVLPADVIPPTVVTLDAPTLVGAAAALLLAAAVIGQLAMRMAGRFRLHDELRSLA